MSKDQKKLFKSLKKAKFRLAFIDMLKTQQVCMGGYDHWPKAYQRKTGSNSSEEVPGG